MATFLIALLGGVVGLVGGFFAGAFIGMAIAVATHMSTFEGAAGYFAVFLCGPIGGIFGPAKADDDAKLRYMLR